jgi:ATP-dependent exoDNAse (exonuclease V) beta subunit
VESGRGKYSVTLQTIHAAKGLEYPIVFIADVNRRAFPSMRTDAGVYVFSDILGLRARKEVRTRKGGEFLFDRWQTDLLEASVPVNYDEERRLFYVAASRAAQYLFLTASNPSTFFSRLAGSADSCEEHADRNVGAASSLPVQDREGLQDFRAAESGEKVPHMIPVHQLMDYRSDQGEGRGREFGNRVHEFAARLACGLDAEPENDDERNVKDLLSGLRGEKKAEIGCSLPYATASVNLVIRGIIDLLVVGDRTVEVIDYKTDMSMANHREYEKQVSVYCHVAQSVFPGRDVEGSVYYTHSAQRIGIRIMPMAEIIDESREDFGF